MFIANATFAQASDTFGQGTARSMYIGPFVKSNHEKNLQRYSQQELLAKGIYPGARIYSIAWHRMNAEQLQNGATATLNIHMKSNDNAPDLPHEYPAGQGDLYVGPFTTTTGFTQVGTRTFDAGANNFPAADEWVAIQLTTPFLYTGGSLDIYSDWSMIPGNMTDPPVSGWFQWYYSTAGGFRSAAWSDEVEPAPFSYFLRSSTRPDLIMNYEPALGCNGTPFIRNIVASETDGCPGYISKLTVDTFTLASGISLYWQKSVDGNIWRDFGDTSAANAGTVSVFVTDSFYYRCIVKCAGSGKTDTSNTLQLYVKTAPAIAVIPFYETFENWRNACDSNDVPSAYWINTPATGDNSWRREDDTVSQGPWTPGGSAQWYLPFDGMAHTASSEGAHSARFHLSMAGGLPNGSLTLYIDLGSIGAKTLSFDFVNPNPDHADYLYIELSQDFGVTWQMVGTCDTAALWKKQTFTLQNIVQVPWSLLRLRANTGNYSMYDLGIDNLTIRSTTCPQPDQLTASALSYSARLTWSERGAATQWQVQYGISGFPFGTGTLSPAGSNPFNLTSLQANTTYSYYVRSACSPGDTSDWSGPFNFTTLCAPVNVPYFEGFESINANNQLPECMARAKNNANCIKTSITTANNPPHAGTDFAFWDNCYANDTLITQPISLTAGTTYQFSIWYHTEALNGSGTVGPLSINYGTAPHSASMTGSIALVPAGINTNNTYQQLLDTFTPGTTGIYFIGIAANTGGPRLGIDDIEVKIAATCLLPDSLNILATTDVTAVLDWVAWSTAPQWQIEYGTTGFVPGNGSVSYTNAHPYTLTGLTAKNTYDYYVRAICGAGDTSERRGPFRFSTKCTPAAIPFTENFEAPDVAPSCSETIDNNADGIGWHRDIQFPYGGDYALQSVQYAMPAQVDDDWYLTNGIILNAGTTYRLAFWYKARDINYTEHLEVRWGNEQTITAMQAHTALFDDTFNVSDYQKSLSSFTPATTGIYYLGFHNRSASQHYQFYIDDVHLTIADIAAINILGASDTECVNAAVPLSISLKNEGLTEETDSIFITTEYGLVSGIKNTIHTNYADTLAVSDIDTIALGNFDLNIAGTYLLKSFIHYKTGDSSAVNDTLIRTIIVLDTPSADAITIVNTAANTYSFTADNPEQVSSYIWDFGDGKTDTSRAPVHTYAADGSYLVQLIMSNTCGSDTITTQINPTSITAATADIDLLTIFPNPAKDQVTIINKMSLDMQAVTIYNNVGILVHKSGKVDAREVQIDTSQLANGLYLIHISTDKGTIVKKLEILK